jgi:hypothetical protein
VQSWVNTGETNSQIINGFLTSPEYEGDVIKLDYQTILHRSPDSVGFNFFLDQFQNHHLTKEKLIISIAASDEFFSSTGGTNASFITALYNRLLNRQPDSGGFNGYLNGMAGGESRQRVVSDMIASTEFFSDYAGLDYTNFLHRTGSVSERTSWANTLRAGIESQGNNFFLIDADKGFLNSPEYASKNP